MQLLHTSLTVLRFGLLAGSTSQNSISFATFLIMSAVLDHLSSSQLKASNPTTPLSDPKVCILTVKRHLEILPALLRKWIVFAISTVEVTSTDSSLLVPEMQI